MCKHGVFVFEALRHLLFISLVALLDLFYWTTFSTHTSFNGSCHGLFFSTCSCYKVIIHHHILIDWLIGNLGAMHILMLVIIFYIFNTFHSHAGCHCQLQLFLFLGHGHRISFIATWHRLRLHILLWLRATAKHRIEAAHHGTASWRESSSYTIVNSLINLLLLVLLLSPLVFQ